MLIAAGASAPSSSATAKWRRHRDEAPEPRSNMTLALDIESSEVGGFAVQYAGTNHPKMVAKANLRRHSAARGEFTLAAAHHTLEK